MSGTWRTYIICTTYLLYLLQFKGDMLECKSLMNWKKLTNTWKKCLPWHIHKARLVALVQQWWCRTFGTRYYDSRVGQSLDFGTWYYNSETCSSLSNFRQEYHDLGIDPSSSYMHGHGHGCGEHNGYLYYEVPAAVLEQLDEQ